MCAPCVVAAAACSHAKGTRCNPSRSPQERTKNAQFVIISLRNNMFEIADRLVGIYKTNDITKSVTINPKTFGAPPAPPQKSKGLAGAPAAPLLDRTNTAEQ